MKQLRRGKSGVFPGLLIPSTKFTIIVFVLGLSLISFPAASQDVQALLDRIERLERDIRTLNTQISRGDGAVIETGQDSNLTASSVLNGAGVARIDARITSLENDVRAATGTVEGLDHRIFELSTALDKLITDVDFRLSELERKFNGTPSAGVDMQSEMSQSAEATLPQLSTVAPAGDVTQVMTQSSNGVLGTITESELQQITSADPAAQTAGSETTAADTQTVGVANESGTQATGIVESAMVAPTVTDPDLLMSPQDQYTQAFGLLRQAKYDDAAIALQTFVNQHPDNPLAANARYWLGETFYVRSEFVRAAEVFFEGYRAAPDGPKAPDTLLKLGMALGNLGKQAEACAAFTKLAGEFPNASTNVRNTMERERLRNNCG